MLRRLMFATTVLIASPVHANDFPLSHSRLPNEDWQESFRRYEKENPDFQKQKNRDNTAMSRKGSFQDLDLSDAPQWNSLAEFTESFKRIRDLRYLDAKAQPGFSRRISWLFPDDGCFARAAMVRQKLADEWQQPVAKLFSFGNLRVQTPNHPSGEVRWAWHVVAAARVGETLYVIDPAIEPERPLTAEEWGAKQVEDMEDIQFSLCHSYAYNPYSTCIEPDAEEEAHGLRDQRVYLGYEWKRIERLNRDPETELGDFPPWLEDGSAETHNTKLISIP